jgi:hypothetical protein
MAEVWERLARERRQGIVENGPDKAQHQTEIKRRAGLTPGPSQYLYSNYPLVTTGGGALPLPTCAQPAMLRRANTAAVASANFFIESPPLS